MVTNDGRDLGSYLQVVRRRKWTIIAATIVGAVAIGSVAYAVAKPSPYVAKATIADQGTHVDQRDADASLRTDATLAHSRDVARDVAAQLPGQPDAGDVLASYSVDVVPNTHLITITYETTDSPERAVLGANTVADVFVHRILDEQSKQAGATADALNQQILSATNELRTIPDTSRDQQSMLLNELSSLRDQRDKAEQPTAPVASVADQASVATGGANHRLQTALLGLPVALLLGLLLAFLRDRFDPRVRTLDDIEDTIGAPAFGVRSRPRAARSVPAPVALATDPTSPPADSYRRVLSSLHSVTARTQRSLVVADVRRSSRATHVASSTAVIAARSGQRVAILSFDAAAVDPGLQLDANTSQVAEVGSADSRVTINARSAVEVPNLGVLEIEGDKLLLLSRFGAVATELRSKFDLILVAAAPVLESADAGDLAANVDGVILAVAPSSRKQDLTDAATELRRAGGTLVAAVVTGETMPSSRNAAGRRTRRETPIGDALPQLTTPSVELTTGALHASR